MNIAENGSGSGRLAPLVQAGLAALVAGSLLAFSAIAFNDGFTSTVPEEGVAANPLETDDGRPVVVPGLPGGAISQPRSDLVAEVPAGPSEARRDDVLGTRLDQPDPAPQIQERPSSPADPSGRDRGTAGGSGSPAWGDPRDGHGGGSNGAPQGGGKDGGGSSGGGEDDRDPDPERPEAKPRDEDDEPEARDDDDDDDDDDDEGSGGSYRVADHSAGSGGSVNSRSDEARAEDQPTADEPTVDPDGNSEGSAAYSEGSDGHSAGTSNGTGDSIDPSDPGDSGHTGDSGRSDGNDGNDDEGYFPRGS